MSEKCYLVAGLGNIGPEYAATRHNIGFMVLDAWAQASNLVFQTQRYGDLAEYRFKGRSFYLLKPSTYMNLSGNAVRYWLGKLPVPDENLMVICDDLNLPFGTLRLRTGGSDGGHNGLKNIEEMLQTRDFARLRMGIGHDFSEGGQIQFVTGEIPPEEMALVPELCAKVIEGVKLWAMEGAQKAMNFINVKQKV
ncbi:MAG: aminoacyl-tRNA hydrolase [Bacteroidales bacterium]|nr:aminoacyl-tRNA hydrolase [Bacteroidales bacterium]